jgi:hypothetical protein
MTEATRTPLIVPPLKELLELAAERSEAYAAAAPFPHAVIDGLFDVEGLRRVAAEIPTKTQTGWTTWDTANEWKHVFDKPEHFGPSARQLCDELNSSEFVRFLERLTGISALVPDPHLTAAGYFQVKRAGFLNVHIDFARNPKLALVRRVNVLVYLNDDWEESWGGQLELWSSMDSGPVVQVGPIMNRMVIFSTPDAPHGHPKPVNAPDGRSRLCFSAYYFTSPDAADAPDDRNGVLFSEHEVQAGLRGIARKLLPPLAVDGLKAIRRHYRRRGIERRGGTAGAPRA